MIVNKNDSENTQDPVETIKKMINYGFDILDQFDYFERNFKENEVWGELLKFNQQQQFQAFLSSEIDFLKLRFYSLGYQRYKKKISMDTIDFKRKDGVVTLKFHFYYQNKPISQTVQYHDV